MNSSDNENNSDSNSDANLEITKSSAVVVSSNNDQISIHTNILVLKSKSIEEYDNLNFDNKKDQTEGTIIDVNRLVYKHDIEGIKSLILDEINHKINDNCKYSDIFDDENKSNESHLDNKYKDNDTLWGLEDRSKFQKLTSDQMKKLKEMMSSTDMSLNEIGAKYCVSYSVLRRIRQWSEAQIEDLNIRKINWIYWSKKEAVIKLIKEYLHNHSHTITAKEVTFHINQKLQNNFGVDFIRKVMKHHLRLSFKRVKLRPNSVNLEKVGAIRKLFAFKISKLISEDALIVNIDESSINRRVSTNYTWG